jgi:hypothetical protein
VRLTVIGLAVDMFQHHLRLKMLRAVALLWKLGRLVGQIDDRATHPRPAASSIMTGVFYMRPCQSMLELS